MESTFHPKTMKCIKILVVKKCNSYFTGDFYDHRDTIMFRVLEYVIYTTLDNFIFLDYLYFIRYKLSKHNKSLNFLQMSCMGWGYRIFLLLFCHSFEENQQTMVILTCCITLLSYYLSKVFVIIETKIVV